MTKRNEQTPSLTIGLDVGDRKIHFCVVNESRDVIDRGAFSTNPAQLRKKLSAFEGALVALEAGSQSPWMSRDLRDAGFDVHVVDPRRVKVISTDPRKNDKRDAETLARLAAGCPELLGRVHHRSVQAQADLSIIRGRDLMVRVRAMFVAQVRSLAKIFAVTLPRASVEAFPKRVRDLVPELAYPALGPLIELIDDLTSRIREMDKRLAKVVKDRYPEVETLQQVRGVGPVTAAALVLTIENPSRFSSSRKVGAWVGLCPRSHASGDSQPKLPITKSGDNYLRRLLVQCSHYILGPFGEDCDLRRFGHRLAARGGSGAKKRAAIAVARKLGVLLVHLWKHGEVYEPLHHHLRAGQPARGEEVAVASTTA